MTTERNRANALLAEWLQAGSRSGARKAASAYNAWLDSGWVRGSIWSGETEYVVDHLTHSHAIIGLRHGPEGDGIICQRQVRHSSIQCGMIDVAYGIAGA